jgi:hypothetical protein
VWSVHRLKRIGRERVRPYFDELPASGALPFDPAVPVAAGVEPV